MSKPARRASQELEKVWRLLWRSPHTGAYSRVQN
jgi:hypothetical protein